MCFLRGLMEAGSAPPRVSAQAPESLFSDENEARGRVLLRDTGCVILSSGSYFHAGGVDKPLLITKEGAEGVVPRETRRGQFHPGTSPTTGAVRDCAQGGQTGV